MRKLLLLASACLVAACGDSTSPSAGLDVTGTLSSSAVQIGQPVSIILTIVNRRDDEVSVNLGGCDRPFDVLTLFGAVVGPRAAEVCSLALIAPTRILPGQSVTYETHWSGDATGIGPADETLYVTPGKYVIRPRLQLTGGEIAYGQPIAVIVKQ